MSRRHIPVLILVGLIPILSIRRNWNDSRQEESEVDNSSRKAVAVIELRVTWGANLPLNHQPFTRIATGRAP